jgi:egghead protein (zeste-white 4 protein)
MIPINHLRRLKRFFKDNEVNLLASLLFPFIVSFIVVINHFAWGQPDQHLDALSRIQVMMSWLWVLPLPVALLSFLGILLYKNAAYLEAINRTSLYDRAIYFRLVTRGINQPTVVRTVNNVVETMEDFNFEHALNIPYYVEVVTEKTNPPLMHIIQKSLWSRHVMVIERPTEYKTSRNALYKARALQYALDCSLAKDSDWVFHLDDESQINKRTVTGILAFVAREEEKNMADPAYKPLIGQGTILYYRNIHQSLLYTLADSIRTADDMGRYFLQYFFGVCVFGMHGSFILVRNSVEKEEGFDFHPVHCITEDAYWGLRMMQRGYKFGHVSGFLHEQSPEKASDFIKQRRRWFLGISKVLQAKDIRFRYKLILFFMTFLWALSGLIVLYTMVNILHPVPISELVGVLASVAFAIYVLMYTLGFYVNMQHSALPFSRKVVYLCMLLLLIPTFSILEASGALYGLLYRQLDFYVIKK